MSFRNIFPTTIYENVWQEMPLTKDKLISSLQPYFTNNVADGNQYFDKDGKDIFKRTVPNLHMFPEFKEIVDYIETQGREYWNTLGFTTEQEPYLLQLWANEVPPGGFTPSHNHNPVAIGGVLYVDADSSMGDLYLENPMQMVLGRMPWNWKKKPYLYTESIKVESGKIVMFPGYLMHHVRSNGSNSNRIVFGFNYGLSWQYKTKEEVYNGG